MSGPVPDDQAPEYEHDISVSYAGEDEEKVEAILRRLEELEVDVFDSRNRPVDIWGRDRVEYLPQVIRHRVRYGVVFISRAYATGVWTKVEHRAV